jgi:phosphoglycolate phosphatase-like HAD superfamily hydrolase
MLIFFDIDATLITTGGVGIKAMVDAGRELFGGPFSVDGIPFAGRLDPLILTDMLAQNGIEATDAHMRSMREVYGRHLPRHLARGTGRALPGVVDLIKALAGREGVVLGLLTGNFEETGLMKLRACGIPTERFTLCVWGDESPHHPPARDHLPGVGIARYQARYGTAIDPSRVVIIGDTPHDVACARAHGCRSLGVGTGSFSVDELLAAGADHAVGTLAETAAVRRWLVG